jgi:MFS transporter, FSR family, fosmidomycin resistance protein
MAKSIAAHSVTAAPAVEPRFNVLGALSVSHFLNDMMQSLVLSIYPLLKGEFELSFAQIGVITLTYQICASLLQPLIGLYTDKHPKPYSLSIGMGFTLIGLVTMAFAPDYSTVLIAAALIGIGSAVFHPESSRIARLASGGRHGLAQSIFQVGGNTGAAVGPLLAAWIILPHGRVSMSWFGCAALIAIGILARVGSWYKNQHLDRTRTAAKGSPGASPVSPRVAAWSILILVLLLFSKYFYVASISSYYSFFLIEKFHISVRSAQVHLFVFLFAMALGTLVGGPMGDRIGRKRVIWFSILGIAPFALLLPYADLMWTGVLTFIIGLILSSAFSAIVVFAQELIPGKVGAVSGLFFGFAFGIGGIGAAVLGAVADQHGIEYVYKICAYLPLLGVVAAFLPNIERRKN